jgi:hypothetical protein
MAELAELLSVELAELLSAEMLSADMAVTPLAVRQSAAYLVAAAKYPQEKLNKS